MVRVRVVFNLMLVACCSHSKQTVGDGSSHSTQTVGDGMAEDSISSHSRQGVGSVNSSHSRQGVGLVISSHSRQGVGLVISSHSRQGVADDAICVGGGYGRDVVAAAPVVAPMTTDWFASTFTFTL